MKELFCRHHFLCPDLPDLLIDSFAGRIARKHSDGQIGFPVIISPWFSMLIYHLGDEQYAHFWLQFKDVGLLHRHA
jgi:hypothetical protein